MTKELDDNHQSKPVVTVNQQFINHFNRIINTQDRLNESNFHLDTFLGIAAQQASHLTRATGTVIELVENEDLVAHAGIGIYEKRGQEKLDRNESISGLALSSHQIIVSDDIENDLRINREEFISLNARSLLIAPFFHQGTAMGVLKIISDKVNAFTDIDIQTIRVIAGMISSALTHQLLTENANTLTQENNRMAEELRKSEKKLKNAVHHDYLTKLPNRNLFNDQLSLALAKAKRRKQVIAIMYLDIDHFKTINDTLGHSTGDKLLHAVGQRLKQCIRASDVVARLGGDEFTLLIDDIKEIKDAIVIAEKVLQVMRQPFTINTSKKPIHLTVSIGIAFLKDKETNADDFIKQSDQALYISKNSGRNTYYIFDNEIIYECNTNQT